MKKQTQTLQEFKDEMRVFLLSEKWNKDALSKLRLILLKEFYTLIFEETKFFNQNKKILKKFFDWEEKPFWYKILEWFFKEKSFSLFKNKKTLIYLTWVFDELNSLDLFWISWLELNHIIKDNFSTTKKELFKIEMQNALNYFRLELMVESEDYKYLVDPLEVFYFNGFINFSEFYREKNLHFINF